MMLSHGTQRECDRYSLTVCFSVLTLGVYLRLGEAVSCTTDAASVGDTCRAAGLFSAAEADGDGSCISSSCC